MKKTELHEWAQRPVCESCQSEHNVKKVSPLKVYRIVRGLSQKELGDRAHMVQQRVSLLELGAEPAQVEIEYLAGALGVAPERLFPERCDG